MAVNRDGVDSRAKLRGVYSLIDTAIVVAVVFFSPLWLSQKYSK